MPRFWVGVTSSWNGTAVSKWAAVSAGAGGSAEPTATDNVNFDGLNTGGGASGAITVTVATSARPCLDLDFTGFAGTFAGTLGLNISGNLNMAAAAAMTLSYTGPIAFIATSAKQITSHGYTFGSTCNFNGVAGVWQLQDAFTCTAVVTSTRGTWDTNGKTVKIAGFVTSSGFARVLALGNSLFEITGPAGFAIGTLTNLSVTTGGNSRVKFSGVTAATAWSNASFTWDDFEFSGGTNTLTVGGNPQFRDVFLTNPGAGTFKWAATPSMRHFDCIGFAGTWGTGGAPHLTGDCTLGAGMTMLYAGSVAFDGIAGTQNLTTNGVPASAGYFFNAFGAAFKVNGAVVCGPFQHAAGAGALDISGITIQATRFSFAANADATGSTLTATGATNAWICNGTLNMTGSEVILNNVSAAAKTFNSLVPHPYNKVSFTGGGTGTFTMTGTFVIAELFFAPGIFVAPSNATLGKLVAVGSAGLPITIGGPAPPNLVACEGQGTGGIIACDYLDISACAVGGGGRWFAGRHANDNGLNLGWIFADAAPRPMGFGGGMAA